MEVINIIAEWHEHVRGITSSKIT